jgi:hypothetical protein
MLEKYLNDTYDTYDTLPSVDLTEANPSYKYVTWRLRS